MGAAAGPRAISGTDLKTKSPNCPTGRCGIRLDGVEGKPYELWVDMNYDGGGWVLVLANRKDTGGMKNLTYNNAVNTFNYRSGTSDGTNTAITTGQFDNPNLIADPTDFVTSMNQSLGTVTSNTTVAPDGTTTADTMTFNGGSWDLYKYFTATSGIAYRMSLYVKLGTATNFAMVLNNTADWNVNSNKLFTATHGLSTDRWTKISIDVVGFATGGINCHFGGNPITAAQTAGTVFVWGWEFKLLTPDVNVFLPVKYWSTIGKTAVQFVATNKVLLSQTAQHTKRYRWSYTSMNGTYGFVGGASVSDETSTGAPGLYASHVTASNSLSTYDNDQDTYGTSCSLMYNNNPWWYSNCWDGNYFAGGGYADAPYWVGSTSDNHNYGALYLK